MAAAGSRRRLRPRRVEDGGPLQAFLDEPAGVRHRRRPHDDHDEPRKGQKLFVSSLLPAAATITVEAVEPLGGEPGEMAIRSIPRARGGDRRPEDVRFLHVLKGADGSASADATALVASTGGTPYEGAAANGIVVMFPVDIATPFASLTYTAPAGTVAHLVTGLTPGADYKVAQNGDVVTVTPGAGTKADSGGVLVIGALP